MKINFDCFNRSLVYVTEGKIYGYIEKKKGEYCYISPINDCTSLCIAHKSIIREARYRPLSLKQKQAQVGKVVIMRDCSASIITMYNISEDAFILADGSSIDTEDRDIFYRDKDCPVRVLEHLNDNEAWVE